MFSETSYYFRRAAQVSDKHTYFENAGPLAYVYNPEEDGAPD